MTWPFCSSRLAVTVMLSCLLGLGACGDDVTGDDQDDVSDTGDEDEAQDERDSGGSEDEDESDGDDPGTDDDDAPVGRRDASIDAGRSPASDGGKPDGGQVSPAVDGGLSGLDGGAGGLDSGSIEGPTREDLGEGDGMDVLMIGDSWMSLGSANSGIQGGVLKASGQPYRTYGIGGTTLLGGGLLGGLLATIPTQYQDAISDNADVKTVIMTGGGNDILQTGLEEDCEMEGDACGEQVTKVLDTLSMMWATMAEDGVQDVIYILYATPEGKSVDFTLPSGDSAPARCAQVPAPLRCHILPTLDIVMGDIPDGIHPSQTASDRIGEAVYDMMVQQGMRR